MPRRSLSGFVQRAPFLDVQSKTGNNNNYVPVTSAAFVACYADAAQADPMRLLWTPPVDAWWEVIGQIGILRNDVAAYNYCYGVLALSPSDADGVASINNIGTQRSDVNVYGFRTMQRLFKLVGGTAYTVTMGVTPSTTQQWSYHAGAGYLTLNSKGWAR
jgi:hypothetical protein